MRFRDRNGQPVTDVHFIHLFPQNVAYTGTAGTVTNAFAPGSNVVRITVTTDAFCEFVTSGDATAATGFFVKANTPTLAAIPAGKTKLSAIQSASGGTMYVTELEI